VPQLNITVPQATYDHHPQWFLNIEYLEEYKRGLPHQEDLMQLGHFTRTIRQGDTFIICAHAGTSVLPAPEELWHAEVTRREALIQSAACTDAFHRALTLAADQCIVKRADGKLSIIAGYPWFTDWGRDSMIALPGLCLSTKRFAEAKEILMTYASFLHDGMIPNAIHAPRGMLEFWVDPESPYYKPIFGEGKRLVLYCASAWRSALAAETLQKMGLPSVCHLEGGFGAWKSAGLPTAEKVSKPHSN
jgi:glycogen debranching enzyme